MCARCFWSYVGGRGARRAYVVGTARCVVMPRGANLKTLHVEVGCIWYANTTCCFVWQARLASDVEVLAFSAGGMGHGAMKASGDCVTRFLTCSEGKREQVKECPSESRHDRVSTNSTGLCCLAAVDPCRRTLKKSHIPSKRRTLCCANSSSRGARCRCLGEFHSHHHT